MDDEEDRYEEGRAQAEEDRIAGYPGMNNEDEDDDYWKLMRTNKLGNFYYKWLNFLVV